MKESFAMKKIIPILACMAVFTIILFTFADAGGRLVLGEINNDKCQEWQVR